MAISVRVKYSLARTGVAALVALVCLGLIALFSWGIAARFILATVQVPLTATGVDNDAMIVAQRPANVARGWSASLRRGLSSDQMHSVVEVGGSSISSSSPGIRGPNPLKTSAASTCDEQLVSTTLSRCVWGWTGDLTAAAAAGGGGTRWFNYSQSIGGSQATRVDVASMFVDSDAVAVGALVPSACLASLASLGLAPDSVAIVRRAAIASGLAANVALDAVLTPTTPILRMVNATMLALDATTRRALDWIADHGNFAVPSTAAAARKNTTWQRSELSQTTSPLSSWSSTGSSSKNEWLSTSVWSLGSTIVEWTDFGNGTVAVRWTLYCVGLDDSSVPCARDLALATARPVTIAVWAGLRGRMTSGAAATCSNESGAALTSSATIVDGSMSFSPHPLLYSVAFVVVAVAALAIAGFETLVAAITDDERGELAPREGGGEDVADRDRGNVPERSPSLELSLSLGRVGSKRNAASAYQHVLSGGASQAPPTGTAKGNNTTTSSEGNRHGAWSDDDEAEGTYIAPEGSLRSNGRGNARAAATAAGIAAPEDSGDFEAPERSTIANEEDVRVSCGMTSFGSGTIVAVAWSSVFQPDSEAVHATCVEEVLATLKQTCRGGVASLVNVHRPGIIGALYRTGSLHCRQALLLAIRLAITYSRLPGANRARLHVLVASGRGILASHNAGGRTESLSLLGFLGDFVDAVMPLVLTAVETDHPNCSCVMVCDDIVAQSISEGPSAKAPSSSVAGFTMPLDIIDAASIAHVPVESGHGLALSASQSAPRPAGLFMFAPWDDDVTAVSEDPVSKVAKGLFDSLLQAVRSRAEEDINRAASALLSACTEDWCQRSAATKRFLYHGLFAIVDELRELKNQQVMMGSAVSVGSDLGSAAAWVPFPRLCTKWETFTGVLLGNTRSNGHPATAAGSPRLTLATFVMDSSGGATHVGSAPAAPVPSLLSKDNGDDPLLEGGEGVSGLIVTGTDSHGRNDGIASGISPVPTELASSDVSHINTETAVSLGTTTSSSAATSIKNDGNLLEQEVVVLIKAKQVELEKRKREAEERAAQEEASKPAEEEDDGFCLFAFVPVVEPEKKEDVVEVEPKVFTDRRGNKWCRSDKALGKGAFGNVYLGMGPEGELVAMKLVPIVLEAETECINLIKEIKLLVRLRSDTVVQYLSSGVAGNFLVIVMECVGAGSLIGAMNLQGKLPLEALRRYTRDVLLSLQYLHSKGIVHRDVKPHNVLMTEAGRCKLADFGAATFLASTAKGEMDGDIVGTIHYMSPEAVAGQLHVRTDIWSLGIMTLQLGTGQVPYHPADVALPFTILHKLGREPGYGPLLPSPAEVDPDLLDFAQMCLNFDPDARPSASDLLSHPFIRGSGGFMMGRGPAVEPPDNFMPAAHRRSQVGAAGESPHLVLPA